MGCDMHVILEEKNDKGDWEMVESYDVDRQYALFANLADVRNNGQVTPIGQPKGWPADSSLGAQKLREHWGDDGHSASWLTGAELAAHRFNYDGRPLEVPYWLSEIAHAGEENQRLVFCFDN